MRERTTWDRPTIAKKAGSNRKAEDPRAMNQDHLSQQPSAEKYQTGGPSEFGEDVNTSDIWKAEYKGDQTDRNEIGMPNFRSDSFKNANSEALAKKAVLCVKIATALLSKDASEQMIEDQSLDFMRLSDAALIDTANRLAGIVSAKDASDDDDSDDEDDKDEGQQSKQAKDASDDDSEDEKDDDGKAEQQSKEAGEVPPQFLENMKKKEDGAKDKDDDKDDDDKKQQKEATTLARQAARAVRANDKASATKFVAALATKVANDQAQQLLAQAMQDEQQMAAQQDPAMFAQQQVEQMMAQQGQPQQQMAQQPQQGQPQQQQAQCQDDGYLLDQMLQDDPAQQVFASDDIQMEGAQMDLGDAVLSDADDALRSLFAHSEEYQNAIKAAEYQGLSVPAPVTANTRTASSRTIGTRPTKGVPQLGGTPVSGGGSSEVDNISSLWRTDPDVSNVFR